MNCRMLFALAVVLVITAAHVAPFSAAGPGRSSGLSLMLKAGGDGFALRLCTGTLACR